MRQTVEEAAKEYAKSVIDSFGRRGVPSGISDIKEMIALGFENGAEWQAKQSPWVRAKDRLPPVDENDISEQSNPVLVKIAAKGRYEPEILVYNKYYHVWDTADSDDFYCHISDDDLWMPIPSFDQILEANKYVLQRMKEKGD